MNKTYDDAKKEVLWIFLACCIGWLVCAAIVLTAFWWEYPSIGFTRYGSNPEGAILLQTLIFIIVFIVGLVASAITVGLEMSPDA